MQLDNLPYPLDRGMKLQEMYEFIYTKYSTNPKRPYKGLLHNAQENVTR